MTSSKNTPDASSIEERKDQDAACGRLIDTLTPEQQTIAAYAASYHYFEQAELEGNTKDDAMFQKALRTYVGFFLHAEHGNEVKAKVRLQNAIAWRQEIEMIELFKVMDPRFTPPEEKKEQHAHLKEGLLNTMENGRCYTCGYDKEGHAYVLFQMHEYFTFNKEFHFHHSFWVVERALAATQRKTNGQKSGMIFVFNYKDYALRNTMPLGLVKQTLYVGLTHYPELIHRIYVLDAPLLFRALWVFIQPFLDASTKAKVQFVKGDESKREHFLPLFDRDQAAECMLPEDEGPGRPKLDPKVYMEETPFDHVFAEKVVT